MRENFKFIDKDGKIINCYKWNTDKTPRAIVYIAHGMAEDALRYDYFAKQLNDNGYLVYTHDHRGHGLTDSDEGRGYIADDEGFEVLASNLDELIVNAKNDNKGLELILFAHSMGSFVSLRYLELYGQEVNRVILSGTNCNLDKIAKVGALIAKCEIKLFGRKHQSKLMDKLIFGNHNKHFKPTRTNYDWICSDEKVVDEYIKNESCGFICSASFYYDLITGIFRLHRKENMEKIKKETSFYIFAGDKDPVGEFGKGIKALVTELKSYGVVNVEYKLYNEGRHEMLNEKNRDEVITNILEFLDK